MAWLSGWDKRIKLDISDYANDIGASVTWFPVTVFLTSTQGEEVFTELTTDAEYLKVAFTKADGTTELYAEKELFDVSEQKGIFHVSRTGWTIDANTSIYIYYDKDHADNTTYIGAINTAAGGNVWDGSFKAVFHMKDDTTSTTLDSTSNSIDLTKDSANNPIEAIGKVGQGQDFSSDTMTHATFLDVMPDDLTIECCIKFDTVGAQYIVYKDNVINEDRISLDVTAADKVEFYGEAINGGSQDVISTSTVTTATWYYIAGVHTHGAALKVYLDTAEDTGDTLGTIADGTAGDITIGSVSGSLPIDGIMDELRFSSTPRTAAWLKGTYNSLWDSLLIYGSEETEAADNAIFFGCNF